MRSMYRALDGLDGFGAHGLGVEVEMAPKPNVEVDTGSGVGPSKKVAAGIKRAKLEAAAAIEKNRAAMDGQISALTTKLENARSEVSTPVAVIGGVLVGGVVIAAIGALVTAVRKKNPRRRNGRRAGRRGARR